LVHPLLEEIIEEIFTLLHLLLHLLVPPLILLQVEETELQLVNSVSHLHPPRIEMGMEQGEGEEGEMDLLLQLQARIWETMKMRTMMD